MNIDSIIKKLRAENTTSGKEARWVQARSKYYEAGHAWHRAAAIWKKAEEEWREADAKR